MSTIYANIAWETWPRCYALQWVTEVPALRLLVHRDFVSHAMARGAIAPNAPVVEGFMAAFGFSKFGGSLESDFGFDSAFLHEGMHGDFYRILAPLPCVRIEKGVCDRCEGSGKRNNDPAEDNCLSCDGTGKAYSFDYRATGACALSATFSLFFMLVEPMQCRTSCPRPQLLSVNAGTNASGGGFPLNGTYSWQAAEWMRDHAGRSLPEAVIAMERIEEHMFGKMLGQYDHFQFQANINGSSGLINVQCPGDRCGLCNSNPKLGQGHDFYDHNLDNPVQQFQLLAALAVLHKLVDRDVRQ